MDMKRHLNPRVYGSKGGWKTEGNRPLSDVNDSLRGYIERKEKEDIGDQWRACESQGEAKEIQMKSGFWNFSKNRLAGRAGLPGDTCTRPSFWVSAMNCLAAENEPPGGTNTVTLFLAILDIFGYLWCHCDVTML
ncbi:hypothetical protein DEO72_LG8g2479 [Vigna unguiculata]|uniref:Uncharacterized protein n=1 Tax=Vigna unguiculata TaxID=3917 RepID=A0A4D6MSR9_VIGUN|nr:hypothetical protein DEO72_LG8g2479 [Vigna unguiculata]